MEETFIVKKFAVLGSRKAVKRAFIKEFQGVRKLTLIFNGENSRKMLKFSLLTLGQV